MNFNQAEFEAAFGTAKQLKPSEVPEIAFAGRSNVGKSSLINKLVNRKALARTSSTPGKTQTVNFYRLTDIRLVDLPGYGFAKVSHSEKQRWSELMEGYFNGTRDIRMVVQLIDMRHPPTADDMDMLKFMLATGYPFIIVLTKADKLKKTERQKREEKLPTELSIAKGIPVIPFSAETGEGTDTIRELIRGRVE